MDGDGEDNPQVALNLIRAAEASKEEKVIFARNTVVNHSHLKWLFAVQANFSNSFGDKIKFGNFHSVPFLG